MEKAITNPLSYKKVVTALKAHSGKSMRNNGRDLLSLAIAFDAETDRGAVILAATAFEDKLKKRLLQEFRRLEPTDEANLFGFDRPLGSFSAKIRLAHALRILPDPMKSIAEMVREMRNACAHSAQAISFEDASLLNGLRFMLQQFDPPADFGLGDASLDGYPRHWARFVFLLVVTDVEEKFAKKRRTKKRRKPFDLFETYLTYQALQEGWRPEELTKRRSPNRRRSRSKPKPEPQLEPSRR